MKTAIAALFLGMAGGVCGQAVDWNHKCSDGSMCRKDVEPGRCVCVPTSATVTIIHCPFNEVIQGNACVVPPAPLIHISPSLQKNAQTIEGPWETVNEPSYVDQWNEAIAKLCDPKSLSPALAGKLKECNTAHPAPLKCGKYQHVEHVMTCLAAKASDCPPSTVEQCAPDVHSVTEKEWQELMTRLKDLEGWKRVTQYEVQRLIDGRK